MNTIQVVFLGQEITSFGDYFFFWSNYDLSLYPKGHQSVAFNLSPSLSPHPPPLSLSLSLVP